VEAEPGTTPPYLVCGETIGSTASSEPYQIPPDNPFVSTPGARPEIWALGLRNPWRFSFDRLTHDLYIGDVGQNAVEEIDFQPAASQGGENYGWNILEGTRCYEPSSGCVPPDGYVPPVAEYTHQEGCSVSGGVVYRGGEPELQGIYFYADFCSGRIWGLRNDGGWQSQQLLASDRGISSFGEDEAGNVYLADMYAGEILRLQRQ
jgi:glucose/arabinose dehydrogenase